MTAPPQPVGTPYARSSEPVRSEEAAVKSVTPSSPMPTREPPPAAPERPAQRTVERPPARSPGQTSERGQSDGLRPETERPPHENLLKRIWTGLFAPRGRGAGRTTL